MTQRIFDVENEKDMADLWDILSDEVVKIEKDKLNTEYCVYRYSSLAFIDTKILKINWHDKTEITRPIQEATEADIGKLCYFWDIGEEDYSKQIGLLTAIRTDRSTYNYVLAKSVCFDHCRRLTKTEIEELC